MKRILLLLVLVALVAPYQSFAENSDQVTTSPDNKVLQEKRQEEIKMYKANVEQRQAEFKKKAAELQANFKERKASLEAALKQRRETMKANSQLRRDAFKEKMKTIKDERKKTIAEHVDANLTKINQNRTDAMSKQLEKFEEILTKLKTKKETAAANGKDVTAVNTAIAAAEAAITAARTAVTTQAGKDYTPTVTDETTLKQTFSTLVNQLRTDLTTTHKTIADAKLALYAVARALRAIEPTVTVTPTP